jgi:hypothetical protein
LPVDETLWLEMVELSVNMNLKDRDMNLSWPILIHLPGGTKETLDTSARIAEV